MDMRGRMAIREVGQRVLKEARRSSGGHDDFACTLSWCREKRTVFRVNGPRVPECPVHKIPMAEGKR